jgi:hypothetical protein
MAEALKRSKSVSNSVNNLPGLHPPNKANRLSTGYLQLINGLIHSPPMVQWARAWWACGKREWGALERPALKFLARQPECPIKNLCLLAYQMGWQQLSWPAALEGALVCCARLQSSADGGSVHTPQGQRLPRRAPPQQHLGVGLAPMG